MLQHPNKMVLTALFIIYYALAGIAQINYTANDVVPAYNNEFGYGTNPGYYSGWDDTDLADICMGNPDKEIPGVGVNSMRPSLPSEFLEEWGYDIRLDEFEYYTNLGMIDHTVFVGFPNWEDRETDKYCGSEQSHLFKDIYEPIWDGGENGTPVNDNNDYALYLYQMVSLYKDHVKFWEIWNEPDFAYNYNSSAPPGDPGNWWENDPDPCDYKLKAPIYHYIRTLRISYEVIKYLDPNAYVAVGGLGYPSFLDAILRNTDEPDGGRVSTEYPLKGGAYFDVLSYHSYPHIDGSLRDWDNDMVNDDGSTGGWAYSRHSDEAVKGVIGLKNEFEDVLLNHGYNGAQYPEKIWIITECNIPRKEFGEFIGSDEAQKNFLIKALVESQMNDIRQFHMYQLADKQDYDDATGEFRLMGLYENLNDLPLREQKKTDAGIAYKTTSDLIGKMNFDPAQTAAMQLPNEIGGGAFIDGAGEYTYVLWAKTSLDRDETAEATYTFPSALNVQDVVVRLWDHSETLLKYVDSTTDLVLTGSPVFLTKSQQAVLPVELDDFHGTVFTGFNELYWRTITEEKTKWHIIERSTDGSNFEDIGQVWAAGYSTEPIDYVYKDKYPPVRAYYRLKTEDLDGELNYSEVVILTRERSFGVVNVYPNPAKKDLVIDFEVHTSSDVFFRIIDMTGKVMLEESEKYRVGFHSKLFNLEGYHRGLYTVELIINNGGDVFVNKVFHEDFE